MIDNLDKVKEMINTESDDDFYFLQIIKRRKENPNMKRDSVVIKDYFISSIEYLEDHYEEIKTLCNLFNARAQFNINKRSYKKTLKESMKLIADIVCNENYRKIKSITGKAVGAHSNEKRNSKKWILDIDEKLSTEDINILIKDINNCQPIGDKFVSLIPSKSGYHLITHPFNKNEFLKIHTEYKGEDFKENNPTNLYIP